MKQGRETFANQYLTSSRNTGLQVQCQVGHVVIGLLSNKLCDSDHCIELQKKRSRQLLLAKPAHVNSLEFKVYVPADIHNGLW